MRRSSFAAGAPLATSSGERKEIKGMRYRIALSIVATMGLMSALKAEVECRICKDEGVVYEKCPVCRGTKYVWTCSGEPREQTYWSGYSYRQTESDPYCGYGSTYKPIHKNCKGTRKRINCPNCAKGKTKSVSTGKVAKICPSCRGKGKAGTGESDGMYYIIRDASYITDSDREYVFLRMDKSGMDDSTPIYNTRIFKKAMDEAELSDYKTVYPMAKIFESLEEMKEFLRKNPNGVSSSLPGSGQPTVYIVKDATQITANDRRIVFEDLGSGYSSYSSRNVIQRRFTEQDIEDFKLINPKCRVFDTLGDLKAFMRTAKVIDAADQDGLSLRREPRRIASPESTTPSTAGAGRRKTLTMEELDERIKAEMEHEKEMLRRRLGE